MPIFAIDFCSLTEDVSSGWTASSSTIIGLEEAELLLLLPEVMGPSQAIGSSVLVEFLWFEFSLPDGLAVTLSTYEMARS